LRCNNKSIYLMKRTYFVSNTKELMHFGNISWSNYFLTVVYSPFHKPFAKMRQKSFWNAKFKFQKFILKFTTCKQILWLGHELKETNRMLSLQTGLWILLWTLEFATRFANFGTFWQKLYCFFCVAKTT
jgi:hypothetical protein